MEMSQPDDNIEGVNGGMPTMPDGLQDMPFAPSAFRKFMDLDAPTAGFPTADGAVMADSPEAEEAAYQQWLTTEGQGESMKKFAAGMDEGFMRRMYEVAKSVKQGKF
tara:strand:+ start:211 stop:531 length:321 start_codon:yes stop_codon:yes gene_type:complete